jgi:uncharacterized cofD-like protein
MKNIVCIGGGTGTPRVLTALKKHPVHLSAIITMADNGGSAGMLRQHYGTLPTGDVRRALVALSDAEQPLLDLIGYRFQQGPLDKQNTGSIVLTALEKITGSFTGAIDMAKQIMKVQGDVIPVTLDNSQLIAKLSDGTIINGETDIDIPKHDMSLYIEKVWLEPESIISPAAEQAISQADMVVIGPGDIYTSLVPNLLVKGVPEALKASKATKVFVANLLTKYGETNHFKAEDFVKEIEKYAQQEMDVVVFNNKKLPHSTDYIEPPQANKKYILADVLDEGATVRHDDGEKLARALLGLLR